MKIKGILFDIIGTIVDEKDNVTGECFRNAFRDNKIDINPDLIRANRGKEKSEIIKNVLKTSDYPPDLYLSILNSFINKLYNNLDSFSEKEGLREIIRYFKEKEIKTGIGTGLPKEIFEKLFCRFKWEEIQFDYIKTAEELGKSRPRPDMIFDMMKKFNISSSEFLKVGDTAADIEEGKNAGVKTASILSGTQDENQIKKAGPDFIIHSLSELRNIL